MKTIQIRSHHIPLLIGVESALNVQNEPFCNETGNRLRTLVRKKLQKILDDDTHPEDEWNDDVYRKDLFGENLDHKGFETAMMEMYTRYTSLPNATPVEIYSNQKDQLCFGCALGRHCNLEMNEDRFIEKFLACAEEIGCSNDVTKVSDEMKKLHVATTLGTLRKIVKHIYHKARQPEKIDPVDSSVHELVWNG